MSSYHFKLDTTENKEFYREWECKKEEINHCMPNQFIDVMNEWSKKIICSFEDKRNIEKNERDRKRREKYNNEEKILNQYR